MCISKVFCYIYLGHVGGVPFSPDQTVSTSKRPSRPTVRSIYNIWVWYVGYLLLVIVLDPSGVLNCLGVYDL